MRNFPNIEKSAFRRGEYVGYRNGVWRIYRASTSYGNWVAIPRDDRPKLYGHSLGDLSAKLAALPY